MEINCIVLAGGKSLRFGNDKSTEAIGGRSLLQQAVASLRFLSSEIVIATSGERPVSEAFDYPKPRILTDIIPGKGPLGGIYTGLTFSTKEHNLVVGADMPFLNQALLKHIIEVSEGYDITVPRVGKLVEPLHAVYSRRCLPPMKEMIRENRLSILELFKEVRVRYVEAEEMERYDPEHRSLFNINTKADLEAARKLSGGSSR